MKFPNVEHERRPWRIHELVPDFTLEDFWALPVRGGPDDFDALLEMAGSFDPSRSESRPARFLWSLREWLGRWLDSGESTAEGSLRNRLPADLRGTASDQDFDPLPFVPLYRTDREAAAEISNRTVHGVAHLSWVELDEGVFEGRMAVYVKPRGIFGRAYMGLIKPFRHRVVYPALMRQMERAWASAEIGRRFT